MSSTAFAERDPAGAVPSSAGIAGAARASRSSGLSPMAHRLIQIGSKLFAVVMMCGLAMWAYFGPLFDVILPLLERESTYSRGLAYLLLMSVLALLHQITFFRVSFGDPGRVPRGSAYAPLATDDDMRESPRAASTDTFCSRCDMQRPNRAHHCGFCGSCVRRFDHHCPTVGNCIGEGNYKFFVLFLFYSVLLAATAACISASSAGIFGGSSGPALSAMVIVALVVTVTQAGFCSFHVYMSSRDYTTLEFLVENSRPDPMAAMQHRPSFHNLKRVFGPRPWLWFLPVRDRPDPSALLSAV